MGRAMTAREVLDTYWDGSLPVPLVTIANAMGIRVFQDPLLNCSGEVSLDESGKPRIVFNPIDPEVRQRFTIAHEIGHVALGHLVPGKTEYRDEVRDFFASVRDSKEVEANKFAAQLLMPADITKKMFASIGGPSLEELAQLFNVSTAAMRFRLINLGLIRG